MSFKEGLCNLRLLDVILESMSKTLTNSSTTSLCLIFVYVGVDKIEWEQIVKASMSFWKAVPQLILNKEHQKLQIHIIIDDLKYILHY